MMPIAHENSHHPGSQQAALHAADALATLAAVPQEAIAAEGITKIYQSKSGEVVALNNVSLTVCRGTLQLLMGPSAAGKTTTLLILAGLLTPTSGTVRLLGEDITAMSRCQLERFRLHHVGFVSQDLNLFSALTAKENIEVALTLKGFHGATVERECQWLLEQVGLADKAHSLPRELSGGQQQRVAIARALAGFPTLILADEPTAALDAYNGQRIMELLVSLTQSHNCTVLMATHDPRTSDFADRVVFLEDGKIAQGIVGVGG
jgi:putative ABC transport system ATP-binding protein